MNLLIYVCVFTFAPVAVCCYAADRDGKNVWVVLICSVLFSWLGGILSWYLLKGMTPAERVANDDAALERQREEAALRALGKLPVQPGEMLSDARKRDLEKLLGGKRS